jgi:DNA-binding HxlR family transcriptional regulator
MWMSSEGDSGRHLDADRRVDEGTQSPREADAAAPPPERIDSMRSKADLQVDDPMTRLVGLLAERWTFLILREAFFGVRRFNQMQRHLGVSRNILAARLRALVDVGIMKRRRYRRKPDFYEYRLTERGLELYPAILAFSRWGDRYLPRDESRPTLVLRHKPCGEVTDPLVVCSCCGKPIHAREVEVHVADHGPPVAEAELRTPELRPRSAEP